MELKIEYVDINSIKPYKNNAKLHPEEQIEQIKKSIEMFGMDDPIGIWKDEIVEGHGRLIACKELGYTEVPIIRLDHLSDEERKAYTLAHNKLTMNSDFDIDILNDELMNFDTIDMSDFGFDLDLGIDEEQEIIEDEVPEVPEEPKAKLGDIYQLGNHRLMCGDSTSIDDVEKLMNGNKADMVFTDPPYNIDFKDDKGRSIKNDNLGKDFKNFINDIIKNCLTIIEKGYIYMCFSQKFITEYLEAMIENKIIDYDLIIWEKDTTMRLGKDYRNYYEPIWLYRINEPTFYGKKEYEKNIWHINSIHSANSKDDFGNSWFKGGNKNLTLHPTQKPIEVPAKAIKNSSQKNENILDLFGGSGSTLIACEQLNRKCYMMELDPHYIDVIIQRWENFTGKKAIKIEGE